MPQSVAIHFCYKNKWFFNNLPSRLTPTPVRAHMRVVELRELPSEPVWGLALGSLLHHARRAERAHVIERDCGGRCSPLFPCARTRYRSHALCCVALSLVIALVFRDIQEYVPEQVSLPEDVNRTFTIHACHIRMVTRFSGTYCLLSLRHICSHIFQHNDGISTRIQLRLRFSTSAL